MLLFSESLEVVVAISFGSTVAQIVSVGYVINDKIPPHVAHLLLKTELGWSQCVDN